MASEEVVETVYGEHNKYEIRRKSKLGPRSSTYTVYKNGSYETKFNSLKAAVEWAESKG